MYCTKCGKLSDDSTKFCPSCGNPIGAATTQPDKLTGMAQGGAPAPQPKKNSKLPLIIAIISIVLGLAVVGVGAVMIFLFAGNEDCDMVVESYLDYFSGKEDDVDDFISVAYLGGGFENVVNGDLAKRANEAYCKALFAGADMGGMYSYDEPDYSNWEEYVKESAIDYTYNNFEETFGSDWKLTYTVVSSEKLSKSEMSGLDGNLDDVIEFYEDALDELEFDKIGENDVEALIAYLSEAEITVAYEITVDVVIEGDEAELEETYEFTVAKIGDEWVILEGISIYDMIDDAK